MGSAIDILNLFNFDWHQCNWLPPSLFFRSSTDQDRSHQYCICVCDVIGNSLSMINWHSSLLQLIRTSPLSETKYVCLCVCGCANNEESFLSTTHLPPSRQYLLISHKAKNKKRVCPLLHFKSDAGAKFPIGKCCHIAFPGITILTSLLNSISITWHIDSAVFEIWFYCSEYLMVQSMKFLSNIQLMGVWSFNYHYKREHYS